MPYPFSWTPQEAQASATAVADGFRAKKYKVAVEAPVAAEGEEAEYRPTICATYGELTILVEAQGKLDYTGELIALAQWIAVRRFYGELYIAVGVDVQLAGRTLNRLQKDGVGLLQVEDNGSVRKTLKARNHCLVVSSPPGLKYGDAKDKIKAIMATYNDGDRLSACRSVADLIESEIYKLAARAVKMGWLDKEMSAIDTMDFSTRIDVLAAASAYHPGRGALIGATLKADLQSFRGARNMFDHAAKSRREEQTREQQFPERIVSGARLTSELVRIRQRCR